MKKLFFISLTIILTGFVLVSTLGSSLAFLEAKTKSVAVSLPKIGEETAVEKILTATAYGPPLFPEKSLTRAGQPIGWGVIAVDPKVIPLGTILSFPEIFPGKKFRAIDTGKKVKGARVDIWLPEEEAVKQFGRRRITAVITNAKFP